jgi:hypothetical protein
MIETAPDLMNDDPRKLRSLLERASKLAIDHDVSSVMVGLAAREGEPRFSDFVDYLQSALRVEDGVYRMTRERVVLHLADVDRAMAAEVLGRLTSRFQDEFPYSGDTRYEARYVEVRPGGGEPTVRDVLPTLFGTDPSENLH